MMMMKKTIFPPVPGVLAPTAYISLGLGDTQMAVLMAEDLVLVAYSLKVPV